MDASIEERKVKRIIWKSSKDKFDNVVSDNENHSLPEFQDAGKYLRGEALRIDISSNNDNLYESHACEASMNHQMYFQQDEQYCQGIDTGIPHMLCYCPSVDTQEEEGSNVNIIMSGTACTMNIGPRIGAIDIGVSECAYYFSVALPGVSKDPGEFSCKIEHDGNVHINGVTITGEKTVSKYSQVFNMTFQQQCQSGQFDISFCLPGPVDPTLFSPNFRSDGIFEGVVVKRNYAPQ